MTNLEYYKNDLHLDLLEVFQSYINYVKTNSQKEDIERLDKLGLDLDNIFRKYGMGDENAFDWLCKERIEPPLLNEEEIGYLHQIQDVLNIKIENAVKYECTDAIHEYLEVTVRSECDIGETIFFPSFNKGAKFKTLKDGKRYTSEELGL